MNKECSAAQLQAAHRYFYNTIECLTEHDSNFTPQPGMYSAAQQVAHAALTIEWFLQGAFAPDGFDLDFAAADAKVRQINSLAQAKARFDRAAARALDDLQTKSADDWSKPIADGPILGGHPRSGIIGAMIEHTAHHRGSLAVYARLLGRVPKMPYSD